MFSRLLFAILWFGWLLLSNNICDFWPLNIVIVTEVVKLAEPLGKSLIYQFSFCNLSYNIFPELLDFLTLRNQFEHDLAFLIIINVVVPIITNLFKK